MVLLFNYISHFYKDVITILTLTLILFRLISFNTIGLQKIACRCINIQIMH